MFTNELIQGDATQALKAVPDSHADLIVTDPPYLVNYRDRSGRSLANDDNAAGVLPVFPELYRVLKPNSHCVLFCGWSAIAQFSTAWEAAGFRTVGHVIWQKDYTSSKRHVAYRHESAWILAKGNPKTPAEPLPDVQDWVYSGNRSHPTEKSVEIIAPLIRSFSSPGALVLDPFLGSGSAAVAAALSGRNYLGIELEEKYCAIAEKRLAGVARFRASKPAKAETAPQRVAA